MQTTTTTYASDQRNILDIPTVPVPTVSVPVPTLPPDPLDTPTPEATDTPTPEPADTPTPKATPTRVVTPTPKAVHTATPVPTPTDESSSDPTPVPTSTDESSSDDTPTPIPTPIATARPATQPPVPVPTATPATSQSVPTVQPTSSTLTPSVTGAASKSPTIAPTATPKSSTPTILRDQGTMTALIVTSGLSATTLLTAGVLIGVRTRKKRKKAAALSLDQTSWPGQSGIDNVMQQAASSHLIDQNVMMSPAMQEILQQSPSLFVATSQPGQIDQPVTEILAQQPLFNNQMSFTEYPTELLATSQQNSYEHDPNLISEYHTEPRIASITDDPDAIARYQTEPMITIVQNAPKSMNDYYGREAAGNMQKANIASFALLSQDIRTDPRVNAMKKQAQMGIFVLLDQEKSSKQSGAFEEMIGRQFPDED